MTVAAVALLAGCGASPQPAAEPETSSAEPAPTTAAEPAPAVTPVTAADLGASWRPECPVGPEQLRRVEVDYRGYDGRTGRGALIVHADLVEQVQEIFAELYRMAFPIAKIQPADAYPGAEDELSMRDNNTSAFNCRGIPGSSSWSHHAYGRAIDINPLVNPYVSRSGGLEPATAQQYVDRSRQHVGSLYAGHPAVRAFTDRGWTWGGNWTDPKDYQHFELPKR